MDFFLSWTVRSQFIKEGVFIQTNTSLDMRLSIQAEVYGSVAVRLFLKDSEGRHETVTDQFLKMTINHSARTVLFSKIDICELCCRKCIRCSIRRISSKVRGQGFQIC